MFVVRNNFTQEYNKVHSKILRVRRRGDVRIMAKTMKKEGKKYTNRVINRICIEAKAIASAGYGMGYENLDIHRMYTKKGHIAPFVRGKLKSILNTGKRRRALVNAVESKCLPHQGVNPAGTSAKCFVCGGKI